MRGLIRCFLFVAAAVVPMLAGGGCVRRPLYDLENAHYVRVYINDRIPNITVGTEGVKPGDVEFDAPDAFKVVLYDTESGEAVSDAIVSNPGSDERGDFVDGYIGADPGVYDLVVYEVGSSVVDVVGEEDFSEINAGTGPISGHQEGYVPSLGDEFGPDRIVESPEHFFHTVVEEVVIEPSTYIDTLKGADGGPLEAETVVKSYYVEVEIEGAEWVSGAAGVLEGAGGNVNLGGESGRVSRDSSGVFFEVSYDKEDDVVYAFVNTFEKLEEVDGGLVLNLEFIKIDGTSQVVRLEIDDKIKGDDANRIVVDHKIVVNPPKNQGGMTPGVGGWKDNETDLPM